jgi:hypothetical protein
VRTLARTLVMLALAWGHAAAMDEPAPLPTYAVGHVWPLAEATYELTRIETGQYVFEAPGVEIRLTGTLGLAAVRRGQDFFELTTPVELTWPLKPGLWGTARADWRASRRPDTIWGRNHWSMTAGRLIWSVEGWDDVALGSTTVRALRLVYRMLAEGLATREEVEWEIVMWYAPAAGVIVRSADPGFRIVSFELAPPVDLAAPRVRGGAPDPAPPPPAPAVDSRRRQREAAEEGCGGWLCATPPSDGTTDRAE